MPSMPKKCFGSGRRIPLHTDADRNKHEHNLAARGHLLRRAAGVARCWTCCCSDGKSSQEKAMPQQKARPILISRYLLDTTLGITPVKR
jgi:hypothetical protein